MLGTRTIRPHVSEEPGQVPVRNKYQGDSPFWSLLQERASIYTTTEFPAQSPEIPLVHSPKLRAVQFRLIPPKAGRPE